MKSLLLGLGAAVAASAAFAAPPSREGVPDLDHVFVIVLENHNAFTSFGANGILDNPRAPHIQALAKKYNFAANYNAVWHPSLPNYVAMITGDWIGADVLASGHTYPAGSVVGISDDDSPSTATDEPAPANPSAHRWRVNLPSLAGQLTAAGRDWRAYLQNLPDAGTSIANWPGDNNTAKLYAVKHNPFPYVAEVQDDPAQFAKQVPLEQLFGDLGSGKVPAFSYIVPDQCRDMHGIGNVLAPCGGAHDTDDVDVSRGDDETFWLVNGITGSPVWNRGRNALFVVFDEGNGPSPCAYDPDTAADVAPGTLRPGPDCYAPQSFNDKVVMLVITNYGVRGRVDSHFYDHYSLLKTVEAGFDLPYLGHAADPGTHTLAPLLTPADD
ncbi:MAG TPA: alkaline phosphatase family protein [Candidatus Dormibacteraeota bacterium]|nr:alkaline phosphatase family protein [Candidatus Dormibacteraeota bacterium]